MTQLLFIGWDYQNYTKEMVAEFLALGLEVEFRSIVTYSTTNKIKKLLSQRWLDKGQLEQQFKLVQAEKGHQYDVVFCLLPFLHVECLEALRKDHPEAKFILYIWDAVSGYLRKGIDMPNYFGYFDEVFTFDMQDAHQYGIQYLPLFCIRQFQNIESNTECGNNIYMVGNLADLRRYHAVKQFEAYCSSHLIKFDWYLKSTLRKNFIIYNQRGSLRNLHLSSIDNEKFVNMMRDSSAVFDFANHVQNGFTMRLMENLCAGKKIITNNRNVLEAPFYSPDRFFVYDNLSFEGVKEFLQVPLQNPQRKFEEYHITSFLKRILSFD